MPERNRYPTWPYTLVAPILAIVLSQHTAWEGIFPICAWSGKDKSTTRFPHIDGNTLLRKWVAFALALITCGGAC